MQIFDKIDRLVWNLHECTKDVMTRNIVNAIRNNQLNVPTNQVEMLLALIQSSADEGYHAGHKVFKKSVGSLMPDTCLKK